MSDIVLSAGVRQNLLALQNTAKLMSTTQNRLATGKKVNSALDNPVNFFTASGLQTRASDLSALLDAMSNGVKTLQAADNGLTSITRTLQSMQSTMLQARQDKSFKVATYALDAATIGTAVAKNLTFSGGSVGATPVNIALNTIGTGGTQSSISTAAAYVAPVAAQPARYTAQNNFSAATQNEALTITFGSSSVNVTLTTSEATLQEAIDKINAAILLDADSNGVIQAVDDGTGKLRIETTANADGNIAVAGAGEPNVFGTETVQVGSNGQYNVTVNGGAVSLTSADTNITAAVNDANLQLLLAGSAFEAFDDAGALGIREKVAQGVTLTLGGADVGPGKIFTTTTDTGTAATGGVVKTVDQLVDAINTALAGKVRASNNNAKLHIQHDSTADLTLAGVTGNATIDGGIGTTVIGGNTVRANLVTQFNELRDQLNKFSADASFNGINLLNGDVLKLNFNETGTSSLTIQAKDPFGNPIAINAATLGIANVTATDLDTDAGIDGFIAALSQALNTTRGQASNFGSNLSIVENRQDFTKAMINTLQTGADALTLADTNEEGANLLALQTRQQLSTTALSLAAQADQAVLRLFG
jgi:flagellin-like hook-associated protein FlgL